MTADTTAEPSESAVNAFAGLGLSEAVVKALQDVGYESPSPIQAATIPLLLAGKDVLGQAQTGTGKTAAFALPILSKIDIQMRPPQALVLVPTRELAIQVAEAFQRYASHMKGFHVLPIYGGQSYTPQLQSLRRGVHVVVGTPGRIMDHLKRATLDLSSLTHLVLDEADEMLQMGFQEDVEWILSQAPKERTVALFSATMPAGIRRIAQVHLRKPEEVTIKSKTSTAANIRQRYWVVSGMHKLDALTRLMEAESFDGMLVFARTKQSTTELAERLGARGFAVEALNGDIPQNLRERTIARLKSGQIDIVVATDVAARGLDVERISHVINFDVPYDSESYVHRIGRTGRAGRSGEAILFVAPRERGMLRVIERATRQPIEPMTLPTIADVNQARIQRFTQRITEAVAAGELDAYRNVLAAYEQEHNVPAIDIAAALAGMLHEKTPLQLSDRRESSAPPPRAVAREREPVEDKKPRRKEREPSRDAWAPPRAEQVFVQPETAREVREVREVREERPAPVSAEERPARRERPPRAEPRSFEKHVDGGPRRDDSTMETYRVEVGLVHGVKPGNIVGAIANEAGLDGRFIGRVDIREDHSFVDLPEGMPKDVFRQLQKVRVAGQMLQIGRARGGSAPDTSEGPPPSVGARQAARSELRVRLPSERPVKPGKAPFGKAAGKFSGKPAGKPFGKGPGKPAGKPAGKKIFAKRKDRD